MPNAKAEFESFATFEARRPKAEKTLDRVQNMVRLHLVQSEILTTLADLVDQRFRTGFVRFAGANAIRKLLGVG